MRRLLLIGGVALGLAVVVRRLRRHLSGFDFEKMIARMPENAPPKWMFRNITQIRENTERILALLESDRRPAPDEYTPTTV